jgi:hypothetical protein
MSSLRRIGAIASLTTILMGNSCFFDTRDAEPPTGDTTVCTLESSGKAFQCMADALEDKQDANYERSLSDNFIFSPTPTDSLDQTFPGCDVGAPNCVYNNWTKDVEMDVVRQLLGDSESLNVDFGSPSIISNRSTFVRYRVTYSLEVVTVAAPTDTTTYKGVAHIDVRNEGGNWRVEFWDEQATVEGSRTWGYLRGITR